MLYVWIAVLVLAVFSEAMTTDLVAIWFFPAALVSLVLSLCAVPWWIQVIVFIFIGLVLVLSMRRLCRRFLGAKEPKTNAESLIGRTCIVTEEIRNIDELGEVKVGGLCWSARAEEQDRVIAVGEQVTILKIEGVKLIVK
jgi:membrane protein implicated in regulation of membrane protease activity